MPFVVTTWAYQELVSSAKLNAMCANDDYLKAIIDASGTVAQAQATTDQSGTVGVDPIYTSADLVLTAGTWRIEGGATLIQLTSADWACVGIFNQTSGLEVANTKGSGGVLSVTQGLPMQTRPTVLTLAATTTFRIKAFRNGGTAVKFIGSGVAGAPAAWFTAIRVK